MATTSAPVSIASGGKNSGTVDDWCWTAVSLLVAITFGGLLPLIVSLLMVLR